MSWTCGACTFSNPPTNEGCGMCGAERPVTVRMTEAPAEKPVAKPAPAVTVAENEWVCNACTLVQSKAVSRCGACDAPNPHAPSRSWTCSECTFVNEAPGVCSMCGIGRSAGAAHGDYGSAQGGGRPSMSETPMEQGMTMMRDAMLEMVLPSLQTQLSQATVPASEGKADGGVVGEVAYQVGEIKCARCVLAKDKVNLNLDPTGRFMLSARDIELELTEFKWAYNKLHKLKFSSSGTAVCAVRGVSIDVSLKMGANMMPEVEEVKAVVRDLDVTIKNTKLKVVYAILIAAFKTQIKAALQSALEKATLDAVRDNANFLQ